MEKDIDSIKTFLGEEHIDPATALVQVLDALETQKAIIESLQDKVRELEEDLARKSDSIFFMKQHLYGDQADSELFSNRAKNLEDIMKARGGTIRRQEAMKEMNLTDSIMSKLIRKMKAIVGQCPDPSNESYKLLYLRCVELPKHCPTIPPVLGKKHNRP